MISKGRKKGTVRFAFKPRNGASRIEVAGDFSNWEPVRMRKQKDGAYVAIVPCEDPQFQYKFLADDEWVTDPDNHSYAVNPYGTMNSVASF